MKNKKKDRHCGTAFTTRLRDDARDKVIALADRERRFYGNMIEILVEEALAARAQKESLIGIGEK